MHTRSLHAIDWRRIPVPQDDGYDAEVALLLGEELASSFESARTAPKKPFATFAGGIRLAHVYAGVSAFASTRRECPDAPLAHPTPLRAESLLMRWPALWKQLPALLHTVHPALDPTRPTPAKSQYPAYRSHHFGEYPGTLWATLDSPLGFAQAMAHENAHQKLRTLGVPVEGASRLFRNHPSERYASPIIKGRLRPLTAVFHAAYSFLHVLALDLRIYAQETDAAVRLGLKSAIQHNAVLVDEGTAEVQRHARPDASGAPFLDAFLEWADYELTHARHTSDGSE